MERWTYVAVLAVTFAAALWLQTLPGVHVLDRPRRVAVALLGGLPFVAWDILAAGQRWWTFADRYTLGARLFGLPVEEYAFFVVVPLCALLGYEAVRAVSARARR